jgi:hypothetical protein
MHMESEVASMARVGIRIRGVVAPWHADIWCDESDRICDVTKKARNAIWPRKWEKRSGGRMFLSNHQNFQVKIEKLMDEIVAPEWHF